MRMKRPIPRFLVPAVLAVSVMLAPAVAEGKAMWRIDGGGWGHGVGMSQYGTYGFAKRGTPYHTILTHYYQGTTIGTSPSRTIRVLLGSAGTVTFSGASSACGVTLVPGKSYRAKRRGGGVILQQGKKRLARCGAVLATGGGSVSIAGRGAYRGSLEARASGGGLSIINAVELEDYVRGVVPRESPSSWPIDALKAQAVAARSYAIASPVRGNGFDQYPDTRSQVYGGIAAETARANQAIAQTNHEILLYKGKPAQTFFFSTSGGHTENNENVFLGGTPQPYLRGVPDPYDTESPYHSWRVKMSAAALGGKLGVGALKRVVILQRGVSGRIVRMKAVGTRGKATLSGPTVKSRLGLRDTLAYFVNTTAAATKARRAREQHQVRTSRTMFGSWLPPAP